MLEHQSSIETRSPLWKPVFSYPCSVEDTSTHDSCGVPFELATACLAPEQEWSQSFKQLSKDQHAAQSVCVVVEASYPAQGDNCSIKASFSTTYVVPCAPATPPQSAICLRPLTPISSWKSLPVLSDEDSGVPAYSSRISSPGALSGSGSELLLVQTFDLDSPATPTETSTAETCATDAARTLDFLNMDSRVALCIPTALLKEIIKVPLAAPDDKFLYSVNPVSEDVLPVFSLGAGAFGQVKLVYVETPAPGQELRMCAVKTVLPGPSYQEQDFWHEVEVMRQCRGCPQVLHLFSAAADQDGFHMLMEVAGNGSLRDLLWACSLYSDDGEVLQGFSEPVARYFVAGLLLALQHLHSLSIAHLDIKPENVLLDSSCRAKLADFGAARHLDRRASKLTDIVGTPGYQPPEMLDGKGYGIAADMWSVGMTAYQLVAGDLPADWQVELLLEKGIFRPPAGLSQDLEHLLSGLLATDPTTRLSAAQAMCHPWFDGFDWAAFRDGSMPLPHFTIYHRLPNQRTSSSACQRVISVEALE